MHFTDPNLHHSFRCCQTYVQCIEKNTKINNARNTDFEWSKVKPTNDFTDPNFHHRFSMLENIRINAMLNRIVQMSYRVFGKPSVPTEVFYFI